MRSFKGLTEPPWPVVEWWHHERSKDAGRCKGESMNHFMEKNLSPKCKVIMIINLLQDEMQ